MAPVQSLDAAAPVGQQRVFVRQLDGGDDWIVCIAEACVRIFTSPEFFEGLEVCVSPPGPKDGGKLVAVG